MKINQKIFLFCLFTLISMVSWAQETCPNNEIWYTSSDNQIVKPTNSGAFGANIISNTYSNGKGVIRFDGNVTSIGETAFKGCPWLTSITIPASVTSIGDAAFKDCSGLTSITIGNSVTSIRDDIFTGCTHIKTLIYAEGTKNIFPVGLTSIETVTIPSTTTSIEKGAFIGDERISDIYVNSPTPPYIADARDFVPEDVYKYAFVHIPKGSLDAYSSTYGWRDFQRFKEDMDDAIEDIPEDGSMQAKVYAKGNFIVVNGTKDIETIRVYSMDGKLVDSKQGDGEFSLAKGGIYIVKVGEESFKVRL